MAKHPAAFINVIAEDGTKAEAIEYLQETWDDLCEARMSRDKVIADLRSALSKLGKYRKALEQIANERPAGGSAYIASQALEALSDE